MDWLTGNQVVSLTNLLPNLIEQLGLVVHVAFLPEAIALPAPPQAGQGLNKRQGTLSDTRRMLCDSNVA